jgi:hypothetical protein
MTKPNNLINSKYINETSLTQFSCLRYLHISKSIFLHIHIVQLSKPFLDSSVFPSRRFLSCVPSEHNLSSTPSVLPGHRFLSCFAVLFSEIDACNALFSDSAAHFASFFHSTSSNRSINDARSSHSTTSPSLTSAATTKGNDHGPIGGCSSRRCSTPYAAEPRLWETQLHLTGGKSVRRLKDCGLHRASVVPSSWVVRVSSSSSPASAAYRLHIEGLGSPCIFDLDAMFVSCRGRYFNCFTCFQSCDAHLRIRY